ncbi:MAG: LptA/OstA family protein [Chlamydiae bacterium]|nr:LptA/OstA family protein [Chlamydiota bacterium]
MSSYCLFFLRAYLLSFGFWFLGVGLSLSAEEPKANSQTTITCKGPLDMDYDHHKAVFHQDVVVRDPRMKMTADEMTVYFQEKSKTIDKVIAVGHVRFRKEEKSAKAKQAIYTAGDGKVVLTGDPMVKKGEDVITGEKITFYRDDSRMLVEPNAKLVLYSAGKDGAEQDWL